MKILVIAPHPDDEVLGCGGTIAKHVKNEDEVFVAIVTKGCEPIFSLDSVEQVRTECREANKYLGVKSTIFMDFPATMIESIPRYEFNGAFIKLIKDIKPDIVYLPHRGDMQIDHKMVVDAAMVALRPRYEHVVKKILVYETLSETGWDVPNTINEFIPTVYVDISDYLDKKIKAFAIYKSLRGSMMNLHAAEAFSVIREILI